MHTPPYRRVANRSSLISLFSLSSLIMATEDRPPSQAASTVSTVGDLKALVKDSIREILQEEATLLTAAPQGLLEGD